MSEKLLEAHFASEDTAKELLLLSKDNPEYEQKERRDYLNRRIAKRERIYVN